VKKSFKSLSVLKRKSVRKLKKRKIMLLLFLIAVPLHLAVFLIVRRNSLVVMLNLQQVIAIR
jgi:hypothetical protein